MAGSLNKVILIGNVGKDPEVRQMSDGSKIVQFSLATSESWKDRNSGERKERTEWHRIVIFNDKLADIAERYIKKGSKIHVEGQLQTRKWVDQNGQERYTTEIALQRYKGELTLLDGPGNRQGQDDYGHSDSYESMGEGGQGRHQGYDDLDDDVPF